jgi:hypothetical protein
LNGIDENSTKEIISLIFSANCMAIFQGINQSVYRKHRRFLLAPSEKDVSNKYLGTLA